MATTDHLADPADLAALLQVAENEPKLVMALAAASSRFRGAVRHHVTLVGGDTITLDGGGTAAVLLPAAPVIAVDEVLLDGEELTDGTHYAWSEDGFLRRLGGCWPDRLRCLSITYTHGFAEIPEDIQEVVVDKARALYAVKPGLQTLQVGGITAGFGLQASEGVSAQWTSVVERYRLNSGDRP